MIVEPVFGAANRHVGVIAAGKLNRESGLIGAGHLHHQRLGASKRYVAAAEFLDDVERKIDRRIDPAAANHAPVLGHAKLRLPIDLGTALSISVCDRPVCCRPPSVEK
jgi:hypothetical protein